MIDPEWHPHPDGTACANCGTPLLMRGGVYHVLERPAPVVRFNGDERCPTCDPRDEDGLRAELWGPDYYSGTSNPQV